MGLERKAGSICHSKEDLVRHALQGVDFIPCLYLFIGKKCVGGSGTASEVWRSSTCIRNRRMEVTSGGGSV